MGTKNLTTTATKRIEINDRLVWEGGKSIRCLGCGREIPFDPRMDPLDMIPWLGQLAVEHDQCPGPPKNGSHE